jgi:superfamily I DNA/RNA helicase
MNKTVIIASAGSGKTRELIEYALSATGKRILLTTYTNRNIAQIVKRIFARRGLVPPNIRIETWFTFLLREAIKPYQTAITEPFYIRSINFETDKPRYTPKKKPKRYYLDAGQNVYRDYVSDLACYLNEETDNSAIRRLENMFDVVLVDELQDLVGYDLEFIELLIESNMELIAVGDPCQFTYATNRSRKNRKYRGFGLYEWVEKHERLGNVQLVNMDWSHRCNQAICDFSDSLFPEIPKTKSKNSVITGHDGIFLVAKCDLREYVSEFHPMALRWSRNKKVPNDLQLSVANIGESKGETFDRVVIFPTNPMLSVSSQKIVVSQ